MKQKKVALLGFADSSREHCPPDDSEFELWGMNNLHMYMERPWSRWFDMHYPDELAACYHESWNEQKAFLETFKGPLYLHKDHKDYPASITFPREEMAAKFGDYFCSSVAFMLAIAITEGFEEIHLYGIDMVGDEEYNYQRPNAEYFVGWAKGMGIKVYMPPQCALLTSDGIYGLPGALSEHASRMAALQRRYKDLERQKGEWEEKSTKLLCELNALDGNLGAYQHALDLQTSSNGDLGEQVQKEIEKRLEKKPELVGREHSAVAMVNACDGAMQEVAYWAQRFRHERRGGTIY